MSRVPVPDLPADGTDLSRLDDQGIPRCEGCGHPMSDGTWEHPQGPPSGVGPGGVWGPPDPVLHAAYLRAVLNWLLAGGEAGPKRDPLWAWVHWSSCDDRCEHERAPCRMKWRSDGLDGPWEIVEDGVVVGGDAIAVEASWRAVDLRVLGCSRDLRPENLSCLCLRCYADATKT